MQVASEPVHEYDATTATTISISQREKSRANTRTLKGGEGMDGKTKRANIGFTRWWNSTRETGERIQTGEWWLLTRLAGTLDLESCIPSSLLTLEESAFAPLAERTC